MAFTVPNPVLGSGLADSTKIDDNFAAVQSKIGGNIDNSDIKSGAAIDTAKLSANMYEVVFRLSMPYSTPVASTTLPLAVCAVPQDDTVASYTCTSYAWVTTKCPTAGTTTFKVEYGSFTGASNAWVAVATPLGATTISTAGGAIPYAASNTITTALANSGNVTTPRFLGLFLTATDASFANTTLTVTIKAKRALRV